MLGDKGVALSSPPAIGEAFSRTFLLAAASLGLAMVVFFVGKKRRTLISISPTHQGVNHD
jgi:hypothetical protein